MNDDDEGIEFFEEHAQEEPSISKGLGCFYGGLAVVGILVIGNVIIGLLFSTVGDLGAPLAVIGLLPLAGLVGAGIYWRKVPGFLLGIGLTIAIGIALVGACTAVLITQVGEEAAA